MCPSPSGLICSTLSPCRATLQACILAPRAQLPGLQMDTPQGQTVIKAEPNTVTFWEFELRFCGMGHVCCKAKTLTQRKQPSYNTWLSSQEERSPGTPVAGVPGTVLNPPIPSLVNCLSLETWETTWYFYSLSWWIGFLFLKKTNLCQNLWSSCMLW